MKLRILMSILVFGATAYAELESRYTWSMRSEQYDEEQILSSGNISSLYFGMELEQKFDRWGKFVFTPGFYFASGQGQSRIDDSGPRNAFFASESKVMLYPSRQITIHAGVISQRPLYNSMIVNPLRGYPAVKVEAFRRSFVNYTGQVALPTTFTFSAETRENEPMPMFLVNALKFNWFRTKRFTWNSAGLSYLYQDLPENIAENSAEDGNTVDRIDGASQFRHDFGGVGFGNFMKFYSGSTQWTMTTTVAQNTSAPGGLNLGVKNAVGMERPFDPNKNWGLEVEYFRVEPDIAPGAYAESYKINRVGYEASGYLKLEKLNLKVTTGVEFLQPLYATDLLGDREVFFIKLGSSRNVF